MALYMYPLLEFLLSMVAILLSEMCSTGVKINSKHAK